MTVSGKTKRIFLWSGPRNISTTLMYSFAQRPDTKVFDEPLYGFYLSNTKAEEYHPDADLIKESMECDGEKVVEMMLDNHERPVTFFKNMTHHLLDLDKDFLKQGFNILLTRDPKEMLPSFDKVIHNPSLFDVGYKAHVEMADYFQSNDIDFVVLTSRRVLENPEEQLKKLCDKIGIPFYKEMLYWEKGARPEDGVWAKHWYDSIHNSTGFKAYQPKKESFPAHLVTLLTESKPYYEKLKSLAL